MYRTLFFENSDFYFFLPLLLRSVFASNVLNGTRVRIPFRTSGFWAEFPIAKQSPQVNIVVNIKNGTGIVRKFHSRKTYIKVRFSFTKMLLSHNKTCINYKLF